MLAAVKRSKSIRSNNDNSRNPTRQPHINEGKGRLAFLLRCHLLNLVEKCTTFVFHHGQHQLFSFFLCRLSNWTNNFYLKCTCTIPVRYLYTRWDPVGYRNIKKMVRNKNQLFDTSHLFLSAPLFLMHRKSRAQVEQPIDK